MKGSLTVYAETKVDDLNPFFKPFDKLNVFAAKFNAVMDEPMNIIVRGFSNPFRT